MSGTCRGRRGRASLIGIYSTPIGASMYAFFFEKNGFFFISRNFFIKFSVLQKTHLNYQCAWMFFFFSSFYCPSSVGQNGNWQWLSCSAFFHQYFRVYSPISFAQKSDPNGDYIRRWLPALRQLPAKYSLFLL